jgi:glutamine amidotransferase
METLKFINSLLKSAGVVSTRSDRSDASSRQTSPSLMNYVVSDGNTIVATRYVSSRTSEASSLFFSSGTSFDEYAEGGLYRMTKADKRESIIMIASEPLTFERSDWMEVKTNTMIVITPKVSVQPSRSDRQPAQGR